MAIEDILKKRIRIIQEEADKEKELEGYLCVFISTNRDYLLEKLSQKSDYLKGKPAGSETDKKRQYKDPESFVYGEIRKVFTLLRKSCESEVPIKVDPSCLVDYSGQKLGWMEESEDLMFPTDEGIDFYLKSPVAKTKYIDRKRISKEKY